MFFTVAGLSGSLKVMTIGVVFSAMVAPFAGVAETTVSEPAPTGTDDMPVVKLLLNEAAGFPWASVNPPTATL